MKTLLFIKLLGLNLVLAISVQAADTTEQLENKIRDNNTKIFNNRRTQFDIWYSSIMPIERQVDVLGAQRNRSPKVETEYRSKAKDLSDLQALYNAIQSQIEYLEGENDHMKAQLKKVSSHSDTKNIIPSASADQPRISKHYLERAF